MKSRLGTKTKMKSYRVLILKRRGKRKQLKGIVKESSEKWERTGITE